MISKNECLSILVEMESNGIQVNSQMRALLGSKDIPIEVLRFIATNKGFDFSDFYENLRRKHNKNKSKLYLNLVGGNVNDSEIPVILSSLLTQIYLYLQDHTNATSARFFKEVRLFEIIQTLDEMAKTDDIEKGKQLLRLIRSDILVIEYLIGRRELN